MDEVMYTIFCQWCKTIVEESPLRLACPECGGPLDFQYSKPRSIGDGCTSSIWRYRDVLPVRPEASVVTLSEGWTPLQKARSFVSHEVRFKNEALNPTGSHKDRALSIGITKALELGKDPVMLYSDGSTALSSAAYAARAGLRNITLVPAHTPRHRLLPLVFYNSILLEFQGPAEGGLSWVHAACRKLGIYETSNYRQANPYEFEGAKTIGFEIYEQLPGVPDWVVIPVGGGGTLAGIWRAFRDLQSWGFTTRLPHMIAVLPEHYNVLEEAMTQGVTTNDELKALAPATLPATIQAKIAMSFPPDGLEAVAAIRESAGLILYASDPEVLRAQKTLASHEGIYAEPSAAAAWVGVEKLLASGRAAPGESVVAIVTGSGFRETGTVADLLSCQTIPISPEIGYAALDKILWGLRPQNQDGRDRSNDEQGSDKAV
jgi:threonine synthase